MSLGQITTPWGPMTNTQALVGGAAAVAVACSLSRTSFGRLVVIGGAVGLIYYLTRKVAQPKMELAEPIPEGGRLTGRMTETTSGGKPGEEVVGFSRNTYAEIALPSGQTDWVRVKIAEPWRP